MKLSIVVAVQGGSERLPELLSRLGPQLEEGTEALVAHGAELTDVPNICGGMPGVRCLPGEAGALSPELWRDGIHAARGERVALTIVHCRPPPRWVRRLLEADLTRFAGVGGPLVNAAESDGAGWAVFMMRYLRYRGDGQCQETDDIPGDNAVYRRQTLLRYAPAFAHGFWEPEVHALMLADGERLAFDPALATIHHNGYAPWSFAAQRYRHATQFGRDRALRMSPLRRAAQLAATPAVPVIFGAKILRSGLGVPEVRRHIPEALPYLALFLEAWALGEARGVLSARHGGIRAASASEAEQERHGDG